MDHFGRIQTFPCFIQKIYHNVFETSGHDYSIKLDLKILICCNVHLFTYNYLLSTKNFENETIYI